MRRVNTQIAITCLLCSLDHTSRSLYKQLYHYLALYRLEQIVNKANGQCTCSVHSNLYNRGTIIRYLGGGGAGVFTCELTCPKNKYDMYPHVIL